MRKKKRSEWRASQETSWFFSLFLCLSRDQEKSRVPSLKFKIVFSCARSLPPLFLFALPNCCWLMPAAACARIIYAGSYFRTAFFPFSTLLRLQLSNVSFSIHQNTLRCGPSEYNVRGHHHQSDRRPFGGENKSAHETPRHAESWSQSLLYCIHCTTACPAKAMAKARGEKQIFPHALHPAHDQTISPTLKSKRLYLIPPPFFVDFA